MWKEYFVLSAFLSLYSLAVGTPVTPDDYDLEDVDLNATSFEINQVALSSSQQGSGQKQYSMVAAVSVNWHSAQQSCGLYNLNLASVNSYQEDQQLQNYINSIGFSGESFWLAGSILSGQNRWFWYNSGKPILYSNWRPGQPNSWNGVKQCVGRDPGGTWNVLNCYETLYFICENRCPLTSYDVPLYPSKK